MAYSLGQHTYEEKGEEQSWVTDTFSRVDVYTKSVVEHQEKLRMDLRVCIWRRRSLHGTSKNGELREEAIPVIPVLKAPRQRRGWHLVG